MPKMQSCCIRGCDSYKQTAVKNIGYFKFPLHDIFLLKKWLRQINRSDWKPSEISQICSAHFREEDMERPANRKHPVLSSNSVPTIFPVQKKVTRARETGGEGIEELNKDGLKTSRVEIGGFEPHRNKVSLLRRKSATREEPKLEIELQSKLKTMLKQPDAADLVELVSSSSLGGRKPFLRITVNKKLNVPTSSKPAAYESIFLPDHGDDRTASGIAKVEKKDCVSYSDSSCGRNNFSIRDHSGYSKSTISKDNKDRCKLNVKQYSNKMKLLDCASPQTVSLDHVYSYLPAVNVRSVNSKARQKSDQLRMRLEELRERRKREQLKIVRLQMHLVELEKKMKENNQEEIVLPNLGEGSKPAGSNSSWLIREKEEYEKLLKDVREIKLKVLRERHNRELENVRRLQIQMTNLRKKMKENDEKEIALANLKETNNSAVNRPDWMKREEEEYEKLLQDVRKIKQAYQSRKTNRQDLVKSDSVKVMKCEKVLSDEDCVLIETMQKKSRLAEEIENGNRSMRKIKAGIGRIDNNDEYGEVIGEIDEDSIDIDMTKEVTILNFNELPDPGLLDS